MIEKMFNKRDGKWYTTDDHQHTAYAHLWANDRAALFLEMSLSKTVVALSFLFDMIYREGAMSKALVIAPDKVARITWVDEINQWQHLEGARYSLIAGDPKKRKAALNTDANIYFLGVNNVEWLCNQYLTKSAGGKWKGALPFDCILIDESSLFKSPSSRRFKTLRRAIKPVKYRYEMTGTATSQGLIDLWAPVYLLDEGERLERTFTDYVDKYFTRRGNGQIVYEYKIRKDAPAVIASKIKDICLSMKARDYIKLPPLIPINREVRINEDEYNEFERDAVLQALEGDITADTAAALSDKLLQYGSGAIYQPQDYDDKGRKLPRTWVSVNDAKIRELARLFDEYPNENFLIVYSYKHEIERIKAAFPFAVEFGKGAKSVDTFRAWSAGKIRALLVHPASVGYGLNFQFGGRAFVWFTPTWNLEHYQQTCARLVRRGVTRDVLMFKLIAKHTRDRRVYERLNAKESVQSALMKDLKELQKKWQRNIKKA